MLSQRCVTVFGGSGFIGRYVVARLADLGWTVRVAVRRPSRAEFLKPLGDVAQVVPLRCNLTNDADVRNAVTGADAVINLVGILQSHGKQTFDAVHVEGTRSIVRAAAEAGITHFVQVSALGASADSGSDYARTKAAAEQVVLEAIPEAVVLRPSVVFGPEDSFFNRFASMARFSPVLPLIGGGKTRFQPVYVGDVADAVVAALTRRDAAGKVYELGGPKVYSFEELMRLMLRVIERRRCLVSLPWGLASRMGAVFQALPGAPITRDQVEQLKSDNVVGEGHPGFAELGIDPHTVEVILPTYLDRYRRFGRAAGRLAPGGS